MNSAEAKNVAQLSATAKLQTYLNSLLDEMGKPPVATLPTNEVFVTLLGAIRDVGFSGAYFRRQELLAKLLLQKISVTKLISTVVGTIKTFFGEATPVGKNRAC